MAQHGRDRVRTTLLAAALAVGCGHGFALGADRKISDGTARIGLIFDLSGFRADVTGPGSVATIPGDQALQPRSASRSPPVGR